MSRFSPNHLHQNIVLAFCLGSAIFVHAQTPTATDSNTTDGNAVYELPTVNVIGQRNNHKSVGKTIFRQENLDNIQANNIASVLDKMPGVAMAGSPRPGGQNINIWGMGKSVDVPITVDGALKTFDRYRQGSVFIEPDLIKRVTVEKGAHEASMGNGGFGGNVQLDTKDAQDFLENDENLGGLVKYTRHSNNHQNTYSVALFGQTGNQVFDWLLYATRRDAGNIKRPDGSRFLFSEYKQDSYLLKGNIRPNDEHKITWSLMDSGHKGWEPVASMRDEMNRPSDAEIKKYGLDEAWRRKLVYRDQQDKSASLAYEYTPLDNELIDLHMRMTYSQTKQHDLRPDSASNVFGSLLGNENWIRYRNTNIDIHNTSTFNTKEIEHALKVGLQHRQMKQDIWMFDRSKAKKADYNFGYYEPPSMPNGTQKTQSAFIEDAMTLGNWTVTPSLRYDHVTNEGNGNILKEYYQNNHPKYMQDYQAKSYAGFSPRVSVYWRMTPNIAWFANYARTWRAPTIDEQYTVQATRVGSSPIAVTGTSRQLSAEKMHAWRFGNVMDFDNLLSSDDHLQVRSTFFYNRGKDEIFRNQGTRCAEQAQNSSANCGEHFNNYRNVGNYTIKGFELESFYNSTYVFAGLSLSTMKGMRDHSPLDPWYPSKTWYVSIPPRKATATLGFNVPQWHFSMGWRGDFVRRQDRQPSNQDSRMDFWQLPATSGYALHSVFASWEPKHGKGKTKVNLNIDNLFNKDYAAYLGEKVTGTGRDIRISLSHQF